MTKSRIHLPRSSFLRTAILALAVLGFVGAGCSSTAESAVSSGAEISAADETTSDDTSSDDDAPNDEESDDSAGVEVVEDGEPKAWEEFSSPIQEFLGVDFASFDEENFETEMADFERDAQQAIQKCMIEQGFEYTPVDSSSMMMFDGPGAELEYGSDAWIEKYALGISTQRFQQSILGPDLIGFDDSMYDEMDEEFEDPNFEYMETLPEAERMAYERALYGDFPEFDETLSEEEMEELWMNFEPTGCQADAYNNGSMFGGENAQDFYMEFGDQMDEMYERAAADPRLVAVRTGEVNCLAEAGHTFDADSDLQQQIYEDIEARLETIERSMFSGDPFEGLDTEVMSEEEIDAALSSFESEQELSDQDKAVIADVQTYEFGLAEAVLECVPGYFDGDPLFFEVLAEYEQAFLDENADALAQFAG